MRVFLQLQVSVCAKLHTGKKIRLPFVIFFLRCTKATITVMNSGRIVHDGNSGTDGEGEGVIDGDVEDEEETLGGVDGGVGVCEDETVGDGFNVVDAENGVISG